MPGEGVLRARRHQMSLLVAGGAAVFLGTYLLVVSLIGAGVREGVTPPPPPKGGASVSLVQTHVTAAEPSLTVRVVLVPSGDLVDQDDRLEQDITLVVQPSLSADLVYPAGKRATSRTIKLPLTGDLQNYPFDTYDLRVELFASTGADDGSLDLEVVTDLRDPGWASQTRAGTHGGVAVVEEQISRARTTKAISLMLLGFMVALATVAALVALAVLAGQMEVQVGIASWLAALLFALIPLRNFLPGTPPVGSWIDILVFFWVEIVIMSSIIAVVVTLLVTSRRQAAAVAEEQEQGPQEQEQREEGHRR